MDAVTAIIPILITVAIAAVPLWWVVRHRPRGGGPLPDVPEAPPTAPRSEAPGLEMPYSSLDPYAPPKRHADGTRVDGYPDST